MAKTAIIVGCYTEYDKLILCLESIRNQPNQSDITIIGVNNGQDARLRTSIENIFKRYLAKRDKYIEYKIPVSIYKWWNDGILEARNHDIIGILNDDVIIPRGGVRVLVEQLKKYDLGMIWPDTMGGHIKDPHLIAGDDYLEKSNMDGWCFFCPTKTYERYGIFDERFLIHGGDTDFFYRIISLGVKTRQSNNVVIYHFGSASLNKIREKVINILEKDHRLIVKLWPRPLKAENRP